MTIILIEDLGLKWLDDNGKLHREDGPAMITHVRQWFKHGTPYRSHGPVIENLDGSVRFPASWFLNGEYMSEEEYYRLTK
jgi:hypothetical protein